MNLSWIASPDADYFIPFLQWMVDNPYTVALIAYIIQKTPWKWDDSFWRWVREEWNQKFGEKR